MSALAITDTALLLSWLCGLQEHPRCWRRQEGVHCLHHSAFGPVVLVPDTHCGRPVYMHMRHNCPPGLSLIFEAAASFLKTFHLVIVAEFLQVLHVPFQTQYMLWFV
ncbi:hypothetical protein COO60DRAFT_1537911 [Scenedesmus sp. NREL 46B-D3]|nr:hypothetical protein COO60DRAFT_1537911 [Scenedesmus sp. NREL 46B-D3]